MKYALLLTAVVVLLAACTPTPDTTTTQENIAPLVSAQTTSGDTFSIEQHI